MPDLATVPIHQTRKPWYTSRTIIGGLLTVGSTAILGVVHVLQPQAPAAVVGALSVLTAVGGCMSIVGRYLSAAPAGN